MMQVLSEADINLELALGGTFRKERIERLRHHVRNLERQGKNAAVPRHKLILAMRDQIEWELARG